MIDEGEKKHIQINLHIYINYGLEHTGYKVNLLQTAVNGVGKGLRPKTIV